ncbi:cytochrome c [Pseudoroseicyclus sp. CXY001]|uniref:c-type cytochrome n=1 Tax=Pseudoroseicyclus sp. CXY001 TaxID=3242492 RepID=UPI00358DD618
MPAQSRLAAIALALTLPAAPLLAQGMDPAAAAINARQSHMVLQQTFLMPLGGMAQGQIEYDAETAAAAAANLAAVSSVDPRFYFPEGTSSADMEGTKALPAIWENPEGFAEAWAALATASTALAEVAGDGPEALQGAFGAVGAACGGCHRSFRQSE